MWKNDQRPPRGRLRIYPLHHGIFTNKIGGGGGLQLILSGVKENQPLIIVLVKKERDKTICYNKSYLQLHHHIVSRNKQPTTAKHSLPTTPTMACADIPMPYQLHSRSHRFPRDQLCYPQAYHREPEYTNPNNTKTPISTRLMVLAVQPIDLNIAFTLNDEQSRRATTALTAKHLLATTVATAGTDNLIPCQLYSHRLSPDRLCHTQTNHRESEYSNIKAMIWTGLTMPAVQLTYLDIAFTAPSNYSSHHPNRNSASPTLPQPRCMDFKHNKMTIEIKDVVALKDEQLREATTE